VHLPSCRTKKIVAAPINAGNASKTTACLRQIVRQYKFPKSNDKGLIYLCEEGISGNQVELLGVVLTERHVHAHIKEKFPSYPLLEVENPALRALSVKGDLQWTEESIWEASNCFYIPTGTIVLVVYPDFFVREILSQYANFVKRNPDGTQGIMTPCPFCKTNQNTSHLIATRFRSMKRAAARVSSSRCSPLAVNWCNLQMLLFTLRWTQARNREKDGEMGPCCREDSVSHIQCVDQKNF
jgi:hypothetical protein